MDARQLVRALSANDHRLGDLIMYANDLDMEPGEDEGEPRFRERVAGRLRSRGQIIEAHEIIAGCRFDDPEGEQVIVGVTGAIASALGHGPPSRDPVRQIGDDIAIGTIVREGRPNPLGAMFDTLGPEVAMDIISAFGGRS